MIQAIKKSALKILKNPRRRPPIKEGTTLKAFEPGFVHSLQTTKMFQQASGSDRTNPRDPQQGGFRQVFPAPLPVIADGKPVGLFPNLLQQQIAPGVGMNTQGVFAPANKEPVNSCP